MKYFKASEFECPCCGENLISTALVEKLDKAREYAGVPFGIESGYRCESHNIEVGGKPESAHLRGLAVDIVCTDSRSRFLIIQGLIMVGFNRIGVADTFIHADIDKSKDDNVIWTY